MKRLITLYICVMCAMMMFAQTDRQHIRQGNRLYRQQKFDKAETDYRKASDKNQRNAQAIYNLGCALMMQQKDSMAMIQFQNAGKMETSKIRKAKSFHNMGTIFQAHQMFAQAIEAYKESLRNNPTDDETRYNLALCQRQLKNQPQNPDNNQDNDKDDNGEDKKQEQQEKKNDNSNKDKQQPQPKEQMSRENAEQLLQAVMQNERNTQEKMQKQQGQPKSRRLQKNW